MASRSFQTKPPAASAGRQWRSNTSAFSPLRIVPAGDRQEREADSIARSALGPHHGDRASSSSPDVLGAGRAPAIVDEALASPGRPLDRATRSMMEPRFGHDFSRVRIHVDQTASRSARAIQADAYAVGRNIAFDAGRYQPATASGQALIAHELAHVVQHDTTPVKQRVVARRETRSNPLTTIGGFFKSLFHTGKFDDGKLLAYLAALHDTNLIEGDPDSDDMAREIVQRWDADPAKFSLKPRHKRLLIEEMLDGSVSKEDREGILHLLEKDLRNEDAMEIFINPGLDIAELVSALGKDDSRARLSAVLSRHFEGGQPAVLAGKKTLKTSVSSQQPAAPPAAAFAPVPEETLTPAERAALGIAKKLRGNVKTEHRNGREFQTGGITADAAAQGDFKRTFAFINATDAGHLEFFGDKLGIDTAYNTPRDPFRWNMLKTMVTDGSVEIHAVGRNTRFKATEKSFRLPDTVVEKSLRELDPGHPDGANGVTVLRPSLRAIVGPPTNPRAKELLSLNSNDQVFYMRGFTSGAHELFGHVWLAMHGVQSGHDESLGGTQSIRDPLGEKFTGGVNTFIDEFIQDRGHPDTNLRSQTEDVSQASLDSALDAFVRAASAPNGLIVTASRAGLAPQTNAAWQVLRRIHVILLRNSSAEKKRLDGIIAKLKPLRDGLQGDRKEAFDLMMYDRQTVLGNPNPEAHVVRELGITNPHIK